MRVNTEKTFFYLLCDDKTVLFIEIKYFIWKNLFWNEVQNKNDFLIMRIRQLKRRKKNLIETIDILRRTKKQNKNWFNNRHDTKNKQIKKNLIFLHDIQYEKNKNTKKKLYFKWNESYRIFKIIDNKNIYLLTELNDTEIMSTFAENRFKKFHVRFFNASEQIKNSAESRVMIDRFSFFEIFSKSEFFDDFFDATFDYEIFKTNENSISSDWFLTVVVFFFAIKLL